MNTAHAPRFDVTVTHHRLTRGVVEAADRRLPAGFEPAVRGAFHLGDTLELRLVGAPAGEPPVRAHRLRVQAMTHAGDLLRGGLCVGFEAEGLGLDVLRADLGPALPAAEAVGSAAERKADPPRRSLYPLAADAAAAAEPAAAWLLALPGGRVRTLRFADAACWTPTAPAGTDPFWAGLAAEAGFGVAAAESRVAARAVPLDWHATRPRPLLAAPPRCEACRPIAAVA